MADPTAYEIGYSFAGFQSSNPSSPMPADFLDAELQNIETAIAEVVAAIQDIRASDGGLHTNIVGVENLTTDFITPVPPATVWATATAYVVGDAVYNGSKLYKCIVAHTSGTFATDLAAGKWLQLVDFTPAGGISGAQVSYDPTASGMAATNVQEAIDEVEDRLGDLEGGGVDLGDLSAAVLLKLMPVGVMTPFAGSAAPSGWLLCDGSLISRTTYSALFSAIGTAWGAGDGSTTFKLPDLKGRVVAGLDNMGGTSSNRLTGQSFGVDGDVLGGYGGAETHALTSAQNGQHTHNVSLTSAAGGAHGHPMRASDTTGSPNGAVGGFVLDNGGTVTNYPAHDSATPADPAGDQIGVSATHTHLVSGASAASGSGTAHNNVQPTAIASYIIFAGV